MWWTVMRHEWRVLRAERTLLVLGAALTLAVIGALANGVAARQAQVQAIVEALDEERDRHAAAERTIREARDRGAPVAPFADPANPDAAGRRHAPRYAVLPPSPLAGLAVGQSDLLPGYIKVTSDSREAVMAAQETENPVRLLTGRFDLAFVVVYLYPLLIVALGYNLLSAEEEQGTLALALSQPIHLRDLVIGKVLARFAVLLGVVIGLVALAPLVAGVRLAAGDTLPRLVMWGLVITAYGLFWFALAFHTASLRLGSAVSAMLLCGIWLVLSVLLPSAMNLGVTALHPVPSRVELVQAVREASQTATAEGARLLGRYYQDHPEFAAETSDQAAADFTVVRLAVDERTEEMVRPVVERFETQLARQQALVDRARILSPAVLVQDALADLSGTGAPRHRRFVAQVGAFHARWRDHFASLTVRKARVEDYGAVPAFTFEDERLAEVVRRVGWVLAVLVGAAAAVTLAGLRRLAAVRA